MLKITYNWIRTLDTTENIVSFDNIIIKNNNTIFLNKKIN